MKLLQCLILLLGVATPVLVAAADDVTFQRVIGPEFPGKYKHPASIDELDNGDLYIAYYGGDGEYAEVTAVYGMLKRKGDTTFPNPNAAVDFLKLANGHLLLVFNDSGTERTGLTVAISTDGDKSYPHRRDIATGDHDYAYPFAIQTADGKIHIVYTSDARSVINHAVFDESAIQKFREKAK